MKILIVKLAAIGDVLRSTSLLPGIHEKYPTAEIDWISSSISSEIFEDNYFIRRLIMWGEREIPDKYDLVIGLEDDAVACDFVSSLNAQKILGAYSEAGKIVYTPSAWFDMSVISKYGIARANELKNLNRKTYQLHMADLLGIKISPYVFRLTPDEIDYGRNKIKELGIKASEKIIGINTGAGKRWPQKSWGLEQTIELVKRFKDELGVVSLILGGEQEQERNLLISKETGMPSAGSHSLRHFASIINQCPVILSSDSLAMHFAIAMGKRIVAFFGPTSAAEIELYGLGEKLSAPMDCGVCYKKECKVKPNCMDSISVDEMYFAARNELGKIK